VLLSDFHSIDIGRAPDVRLPISAATVITGHNVWNPAGDALVKFDILAPQAPESPQGAAAAAIAPQLRAIDESAWREMYKPAGKFFAGTATKYVAGYQVRK